MMERTASLIYFLLLLMSGSCQLESITGVHVQSSLSSSFSDIETSTIQHQPLGSPKDNTQLTIQVTPIQSLKHPTHDSTPMVTNQVTNATESRSTTWTTPQGDPSTSQRTDLSTEGFTVGATERALVASTEGVPVGPTSTEGAHVGPTSTEGVLVGPTSTATSTYQYIDASTTEISKQESSEVVHESSTEHSIDTPTKESSYKSTVDVTYQSANSIALNPTEYATQWQTSTLTEPSPVQTAGGPAVSSKEQPGDTSSVLILATSLAIVSSEKYTTPAATELATAPVIEQSTQPITASVIEKFTQPITASTYTEQSTESVTAVSYTEQYSETITDSSYSEQFTESITASSYSEEPTNIQTITVQPTETSSEVGLTSSTRPHNETVAGSNGESNDDWKIAVGVVIPLLVLIAVLVGVYICYRKKYPVRMIIGREFGKFSNPNYSRRVHAPSLVREDADFYFSSNRTSTSVPSQEFNPVNNKRMYDNMGFVRDENADEDAKEREFLQSKSWLFKKASDPSKTTGEEDAEATAESSFIANSTPAVVSKLDANRNETKASTDPAKPKAVVGDQKKPVIKPRRKRRAPEPPGNRAPVSQLNGESNGPPATLVVTSETILSVSKVIGSSLPRNFGLPGFDEREHSNEASGHEKHPRNVNTGVQLFQQPTLNQEVKERSKSLSLDSGQLDGRPRSFSVDPPISTRKMSLYDEIVEATRLRFLAAQRMTSSISEEVSKVTAFLVGVDIRDRDAPVTSYVLTAGDDTAHDDSTTSDNSARWKQRQPESKSTPNADTDPDMPREAQWTNFEEINPQKHSTSNLYDVKKFAEDKNTPARDNTDYYNVSRSSQLLSDNQREEDNNKSGHAFSSQKQDNVNNQDSRFVSSSGSVLKDISYQDDTDSAYPAAYSNKNIEHNLGGMPERSAQSTPERSPSSSDSDDTRPDASNVAPAWEFAIPVIINMDSHPRVAEANGVAMGTLKSPTSRHEHLQEQEHDRGADHLNDVNYGVNMSASERVRKFKSMSPEMKYSTSSTESVVGSSESSRGIPSDDEDEQAAAMDVSSSHEMPNKSIINAGDDEFIFSSPSRIKQPLSRLRPDNNPDDPVSSIPGNGNNSKTAVFQVQYSDSSSDSSDIVPKKGINLLSSERQNRDSVTFVEESTLASKATSPNDGHIDIPSQEQFEDFNDDVAYTLLEYNEDEDIDV